MTKSHKYKCPTCGARRGQDCVMADGFSYGNSYTHRARLNLVPPPRSAPAPQHQKLVVSVSAASTSRSHRVSRQMVVRYGKFNCYPKAQTHTFKTRSELIAAFVRLAMDLWDQAPRKTEE